MLDTLDEAKAREDDCRALEIEILALPLSLFTAAEFLWFSRYANGEHRTLLPHHERERKELENLRNALVGRKP